MPRPGPRPLPPLLPTLWLLPFAVAAGCGGGGATSPLGGALITPEVMACRSRVDRPTQFTEIALRSAQNLGSARVVDRSGVERRARLHPDGSTVVFARERASNDPNSRELFVGSIDGSAERRLTLDTALDDEPAWSPDGSAILFASERAGDKALWLCDPDGRNVRQFLTPPTGDSDGEADWSRATDRIVFSRRDASGRHRLLLVNGDGTGLTAFTDGGTAVGPDSGDHEPAFAPDGNTVAFARRLADRAILCFAEVGTGAVTERYTASGGDVALPRFAPAMDRIFFGLDDPLAGRAGRRLAFVPIAAGDPVLVWPDERWALEGLELLPTLPALEAGEAPVVLDVDAGEIEIAWGSWGFGSLQQLRAEDGDAYVLRTRATVDHDIAGITCRFELPLPDGLDVLELRIRAVAAVSRVGGDTLLRLSLENYVDGRSDTAVELAPATTGFQTLELRTSSLRHLSRERIVRFHIVAEVERGDPAELKLDFVELAFVRRPEPQ